MGNRNGLAVLCALAFAGGCAHAVRIYQASEMCRSPDAGPAELPPVSLIEDAENGDNQIVVQDGRDGYVYTFVDPASDLTQGSAPPTKMVVPIVGGAQGSRCAWNLRGKLADANIVFVGLGMNMSDPKAAYDASRYAGVSFFARRSPGTSARVRVHFPDWNTDPDGAICRECFNDFGADITVTEQWTQYTLRFESLEQLPGWGSPRPQHVDSSRLFGIQFRVVDRDVPFDVWIDDLAFIEGGSPPPTTQAATAPVSNRSF
jgi:endoglucanase